VISTDVRQKLWSEVVVWRVLKMNEVNKFVRGWMEAGPRALLMHDDE